MTINTPNRKQVKYQLAKIRRHKRRSKRGSSEKKSRSTRCSDELLKIADSLDESSHTEEQETRGKAIDEPNDGLSDLLNGTL